jgi:hypothetical protein
MKHFEYQITHHPADEFQDVVFFCSETGECTVDRVPAGQSRVLVGILNEQGKDGWELVQVSFGKDGVMIFWKRKVKDKEKQNSG